MKTAVLVSGSGTNLQTLIEQLHQDASSGIKIAVVISDRRKAYALTRAKRAGIPTQVVRTQDFANRLDFDAEISRVIEDYAVELIVLAGFMKLFQPPFVQKYRNRIINVHPTLLPAFPGAHPVADTLAYGVKIAGVTVHLLMRMWIRVPLLPSRLSLFWIRTMRRVYTTGSRLRSINSILK